MEQPHHLHNTRSESFHRTEYHIQLILCVVENIKFIVNPMENKRCNEQLSCMCAYEYVRTFFVVTQIKQ